MEPFYFYDRLNTTYREFSKSVTLDFAKFSRSFCDGFAGGQYTADIGRSSRANNGSLRELKREIMRKLTTVSASLALLLGLVGTANSQVMLPAGNSVFLNAFGDGVQIYNSASNGAGAFQWTFIAPQADLFTDSSETTLIGAHFAGPAWQYFPDGSSVVGLRIASGASPNADSIPELELVAQSHGGIGLFSKVSYILRLNTVGGLAPLIAPTALGQSANVHYTATYAFAQAVPEPGCFALLLGLSASAATFIMRRRKYRS